MSAACCAVPRNRRKALWFGASGSVGPAVMLVLLPKCPACVAAYIAVFTGAGLAAPIAESVRSLLLAMFAVSVVFLFVNWLRRRKSAN